MGRREAASSTSAASTRSQCRRWWTLAMVSDGRSCPRSRRNVEYNQQSRLGFSQSINHFVCSTKHNNLGYQQKFAAIKSQSATSSSSFDLHVLTNWTVCAMTTSSGRLFHRFTTLLLKKFCRNWVLLLCFVSFKVWSHICFSINGISDARNYAPPPFKVETIRREKLTIRKKTRLPTVAVSQSIGLQ